MPITIDGKTFEDFNAAVSHIKRTKPDIADPEAYVATVERKQKVAIERTTAGTRRLQRTDKVLNYLTKGYTQPTKPVSQEEYNQLKEYSDTGKKIRPKKPTQTQRSTVMEAKIECPKQSLAKLKDRVNSKLALQQLKDRVSEVKTARDHKHSIQFKQAKRVGETGEFRGATQEKYWKYWLLNAKQTNGNGWGVSSDSIDKNISRFIGKPFCVTAKQWFPESEYETYEHPYLPTNNLDIIFSHQAKYSVGDIVDVIKDNHDDYYAMIKPHSKFANNSPPAFCSPAIFQLDPHEPENKISKWEALHLAGLDRDPAYGAQIALLKGTCIGTANECKVQFKSAKQVDAFYRKDIDFPHQRQDKVFKYWKNQTTEGKDLDAESVELTKYIDTGEKINPKTLNQNKMKTNLKKKLAKVKSAVSYNKHYINDPFNKREYGADDEPSLLDHVSDEVERHASVAGKKLLENSNIRHPVSLANVSDVLDSMTRDTLLRIQNNYGNDFEDISGNEENVFKKEADDVASSGLYHHEKAFGYGESERPHTESQKFVKQLMEPFEQSKEEALNQIPTRQEDFINGKKVINDFSKELYGMVLKSLKTTQRGAKQKAAFLDPSTTRQKWMRFIYRGKEECDICRQFDGKVYRVDDENRPVIPSIEEWGGHGPVTHPNCRCKWAKVFSEESLKNQENRQTPIFSFRTSQKTAAYDISQPHEVKINPEHGKIIADAYQKMPHTPNDPETADAYGALINETNSQFKNLLKGGLKIDKITGENPYPNSKTMHDDIEQNNHLYYYPTSSGFGSSGREYKDHPMLQPTEFKINDEPLLANDVFRIVHDINGHHKGGKTTFGPKGEHQAFLQHKQMYTPLARKALFTETAAQNNWVNFGPHGEQNRKDPTNTVFADQKAGILPEHVREGNFHT